MLSKVKNVAIFLFYFVIPFVQSPNWCTKGFAEYSKQNNDTHYRYRLVYNCTIPEVA